MSLFKTRDFWSFNLSQLSAQFETSPLAADSSHGLEQRKKTRANNKQAKEDEDEEKDYCGRFRVAAASFSSIGAHEVLVCADLSGFVCIVQVAERDQLRVQPGQTNSHQFATASLRETESGGSASSGAAKGKGRAREGQDLEAECGRDKAIAFADRQLLLAERVDHSVVDLKCGYFNSALKQSIAVLDTDKLVVYQVRQRQVDLLTAEPSKAESLLSHQLEAQQSFQLLNCELAFGLVVLNNQTGNWPILNEHPDGQQSGSAVDRPKRQQDLRLPQRDTLIVQYTNQSLFTIVEQKRVAGHYSLAAGGSNSASTNKPSSPPPSSLITTRPTHANDLDQLGQFVGPMPMAALRADLKSSYLMITQSDQKLYCLPLAKLSQQTKQSVMTRVAQNLLLGQQRLDANQQAGEFAPISSEQKALRSSLTYNRSKQLVEDGEMISLNLEQIAIWQLELPCAALQLESIVRPISATVFASQLLVMSRYQLDLFASTSGAHLWSQRFEPPLVCLSTYLLAGSLKDPNQPHLEANNNCRLLCLACLDGSPANDDQDDDNDDNLNCEPGDASASNGRGRCSNLLVLEEDRHCWTAQLNVRPAQLLRLKPSGMEAPVLVSLCAKRGQLNASYLGTNTDKQLEAERPNSETDNSSAGAAPLLAELEQLDEPLFREDLLPSGDDSDRSKKQRINQQRPRLKTEVRLEAFGQWPNVCVESQICVWPEPEVAVSVLQDIIITLEFDDLIKFEPSSHPVSVWSAGIVQASLGNCWPDRREPIRFTGAFALSRAAALARSRHSGKVVGDGGHLNQSATRTATSLLTDDQQQQQQQLQFTAPESNQEDLFSPEGMAGHELVKHQSIIGSAEWLPKSLRVKLVFRFTDSRAGIAMLEQESFQLPLNLIGRLIHIDYSSGQSQSLEDVLSNLAPYKRQSANCHSPELAPANPPYYLCDMFIKNRSQMIDWIDELIESDLVCRGLNAEAKCRLQLSPTEAMEAELESEAEVEGGGRGENNNNNNNNNYDDHDDDVTAAAAAVERKNWSSTLENINLLAQSLDCRLKFRPLQQQQTRNSSSTPSSRPSLERDQLSEEYSPPVIVSFGLKVPNGVHQFAPILGQPRGLELADAYSIVWLHLCDMSASNSSIIPEQMIRFHAKEWKTHLANGEKRSHTIISDKLHSTEERPTKWTKTGRKTSPQNSCPLLISIESDHPIPVLFLQDHLAERIKRRTMRGFWAANSGEAQLDFMTESAHDALEINYRQLFGMKNFIVISLNLHESLVGILNEYETQVSCKFRKLKQKLERESGKFRISAATSIGLSKKLFNLPDDLHQQFTDLSELTKCYQLNLIRLLSELETLKRLDYECSKMPGGCEIVLGLDDRQDQNGLEGVRAVSGTAGVNLIRWPQFSRLID